MRMGMLTPIQQQGREEHHEERKEAERNLKSNLRIKQRPLQTMWM